MTSTRSPIPQSHLYRYEHSIEIDPGNDRSRLLVVMKNPSYPDEGNVCFAKAVAWARQRRFGAVDFVNLFARRAYRPHALNGLGYDEAVGEHNDYMISLLADDADLVVAAWGQPSRIRSAWYHRRVREVVAVIGGDRLTAVGTTAAGHPLHPQVWSTGLPVLDFDPGGVRW